MTNILNKQIYNPLNSHNYKRDLDACFDVKSDNNIVVNTENSAF